MNIRTSSGTFRFKIKSMILKVLYRRKVVIGKNLKILGKMPIIKIPQEGSLFFGDNNILNSDFISSNTSLTTRVKFVTGYNGKIVIGNNCDFNGTCIVSYQEIEIGDFCQFASSTLISDTDFHPIEPDLRLAQMKGIGFSHEKVGKKKIKIGCNVWVGWGVIILKGVTIGDNSIIAAGSVVVRDIPPNVIVAGNPAKVVKKFLR
jgi:acetyltransferase-like isoleucine patch superfamily enzyme